MPLLNSNSLQARLLLRIFSISVAAIIVTYMTVYTQIDRSLEMLRDRTVEQQARDLSAYLEAGKSVNKVIFNLPGPIRLSYAKAGPAYQYLVRDSTGEILFRSPYAYTSFFPKDLRPEADGKFSFMGPSGYTYVGFMLHQKLGDDIYYIQVAQTTRAADTVSDEISGVFMKRLIWVGLPFSAALLFIILSTVRRGFRPLYAAAREAERVDITNPDFQIQEADLPDEIRPFIKAINFSFRRMAKSIREQKELTGNLAHELRTPLSVLKTNIEMQGRSAQSAKILRDVDAMIKLVNQMLDMTRLEYADTIEMKDIDLSAVVSQVCQDLWPLFLKGHRELRVNGIEAPVIVHGDPDLIYRAIRNVLDNALEHSPPKTPVDVFVEARAVRVRDYGETIPESLRTKIFDRLQRLSLRAAPKSGAGLGLSIVAKTMEVHGGRALLEPAPGEGNIFVLDFNAGSPDKPLALAS